MANRSYLYSATLDSDGNPVRHSGISEWNWEVPLAHKVLMSGSPRLAGTTIWDGEGVPALLADYEAGVAAFETHLETLPPSPDVDDAYAALQTHLRSNEVRATHFLLEPAEILVLDEDVELADAAQALLAQIAAAATETADSASATAAGSWSVHLYYG